MPTKTKTPASKVNVKLFRKIQKLFREKPSKAYMDWFGRIKDKYRGKFEDGMEVPMCKTHLCIGGSAVLLSGVAKLKASGYGDPDFVSAKTGERINTWQEAAKVLGLKETQAQVIFKEENWPAKFQVENGNARGSKQLAKNMVGRIEYFLKTGE